MRRAFPDIPNAAFAETPGGNVLVPLNDYVGRAIYLFGDLDPKITWVLKRLLKTGDTVLDVGANFGLISLCMSKLVGPTGHVLAFEPNPDLQKALSATFYTRDNIDLYPIALGETRKQMTLYVPARNYAAASLLDAGAKSFAASHSVEIHKLDEILETETKTPVSFMKIDIGNFEANLLRGALNMLQADRPVVLLKSNCDALELLAAFDYRFMMLPPCLVRMRTEMLNYEPGKRLKSHDIVAVPQERLDDTARLLKVRVHFCARCPRAKDFPWQRGS